MKSPGKIAKALIFIGVCLSLLLVFFVSVIGDQWLRSYETYYVRFENQSVSGLEIGATVQYRGISVGEVRDIGFDEDDPDIITVEITVQSDVPLRSDVTVSVEPVGISGISQMQIAGGSRDASIVEPGGSLRADRSLFAQLTGSAESLAGGAEEVMEGLAQLLGEENRAELSALISRLRMTVDEIGPGLVTIVENVERTTLEAQAAVANISRITAGLETDLADLRLADTAESLNRTVGNIETIVERSGRTVEEVDLTVEQNRQAVTGSIRSFQRAMSSLNDLASQVNDDPSLLLRGRTGGSAIR